MQKQILENGFVRLTSANGVTDIRTGRTYSVAVVKASAERFFTAA